MTEVLAPASILISPQVEFSFKVECGPNFDCAPQPPVARRPQSRRRLSTISPRTTAASASILLDRMNQLLPSWGATSEADMGIMLAELIAYVGDNLSYQQDAIATEAYIETARSRISLRRHARLVDYLVHDGCNARAWIQLQMQGNPGQQIFLDRTLHPLLHLCAGHAVQPGRRLGQRGSGAARRGRRSSSRSATRSSTPNSTR